MPFEIVEYLKTPPTRQQLQQILQGLNLSSLDLIRAKDKRFKELGLSKNDNREEHEWFDILLENPQLMERPVVSYNGRYEMGRPPERVLNILK